MAITPRKNGNNREQVGGEISVEKSVEKGKGKKGERWMEDGWKKKKKVR